METEEDPCPGGCGSEPGRSCRQYLEAGNRTELENAFAGRLQENLLRFSRAFSVDCVSRDNWVRMDSSEPEKTENAAVALRHLLDLVRLHGGQPLPDNDFELALNSHSAGDPAVLKSFFRNRITVSPKKGIIVPRTAHQLEYTEAVRKNDVVFALGPAGTGKTYLAVAMAVASLLAGDHSRIILARPAVEAGENLGFLPGDIEEKINPYLRPLSDALHEMLEPREIASMRENGMIEIAPLAFMRGRTLNRSFIILDEAQNATGEQMLMFLTRMGTGSKCIIAGDPTQTDLAFRSRSGLEEAVRILEGTEGIHICRLGREDVLRHSLVERIIHAYENSRRGVQGS